MLNRGMKIKIYRVPKNQNQENQIILLYATKQDKLLELSTRFVRDYSKFMVKKEQQAWQVIHLLYISIRREEWRLDTMCNLYETVTITLTASPYNTKNKVAWIIEGTDKMNSTVSDMHGIMDQKGEGVTKRKYDLSSVEPEDRHSMRSLKRFHSAR